MRKRKAGLEAELKSLTRVVADGMDSPAIRAAIVEREMELSAITAKTLGRKKSSVQHQIAGLRKFVKEGVSDIRALLAGGHSNPAIVRQELARHVTKITLTAEGKIGGIRYKGAWKLLGATGGAGGRNRTAYASLFRAALYQ